MNLRYAIKRFGMFLLTVVFAVTLNFLLPRISSVNPVEERLLTFAAQGGVRAGDIQAMVEEYHLKFGLDKPLWQQYLNYWWDLAHFDLGFSIMNFPDKVLDIILGALPWTIGLLSVSVLMAFLIGSFLGAMLVWKQNVFVFRIFVVMTMVLSTIPYYLLGLMLIFLFSVTLSWLPSGGGYEIGAMLAFDWESALSVLRHAILPALSILLASIGFWALGMRGMMVTVMDEDYILFARAKGLKERTIFLRYAVRNALLPQVTGLALALGRIVSGAVLLEVIFSYPGIGYRFFKAIGGNDYFVIQGIVLVLIGAVALALLVIDLLYPLLDPRIAYTRK